MRLKAWTRNQTLHVVKEFPPFFWMAGYFFHPVKAPNGETILKQNLQEVLGREYFLKAMGEINGRSFLDIGCARGEYMEVIAEMGGIVSGIDLNGEEIERGRVNFAKLGLQADFHTGDARALPFADESFDVVYAADVFEHISRESKQAVVSEIYRVLKPAGCAVIKTPNLAYLRMTINFRRIKNLLTGKSPRVHIEHTRNNPDNEHHGLTTQRELDEIFGEHLFLESEVTSFPFRRGRMFLSGKCQFPGRDRFNECIIATYRKSVFIPVSTKLSARFPA